MTSAFAARDGCDLRFSPDWDGECLVFDRLTTDLFVVPELGRSLLESLQQGGPMDAQMLLDEMAGAVESVDAEGIVVIEGMLREFESCGLVEPFCVDCCGPDAP